jgi:iron complex outermembrane receptor protein
VFPLSNPDEVFTIILKEADEELEEVTVTATRSSRTISDIPTRIETISAGELNEKASMQPANVKMVLSESTGIQTQQTSATSANASIRIQGLDGKYTQLLKDGFPLYSGFSGGLSIVQIPPLDLKRVEVIKGSSSTLYGAGAIAGLINFVTKEPQEQKELSFLANSNSTKALDFSGYYAQKFKKFGFTIFTAQNDQVAYDANNDQLSDIPKFNRFTLNPRIFYYINPKTTLSLGINSTFENRIGGDLQVINDKADANHSYFERNKSNRISSQLKFEKQLSNNQILTFKNSIGSFDRTIDKQDYLFKGKQIASFSELSYVIPLGKMEWIFGANLWTDNFKQTNNTSSPLDNELITSGIFAQNNYKVNEKFIVETGLRLDANNQNDQFLLPRLSAMYKFNQKFTARIGGGLGYKSPTIFSEEAEEKGFRNIEPLNLKSAIAEKSSGVSFDVNYKTTLFEDISFSINQLFFYTKLNSPLILSNNILSNGNFQFINANGYLESKGFETNLKLKYDDFAFYVGYTYTDAQRKYNQTSINPLTAKHKIYSTLMYEIEKKWRVGYELFYTGKQYLSNNETRPNYLIMGISAERQFEHFSLFINAENFTDTRQTRSESIYTGTLQNPQFKEIWAPTDGFILNGGFKINVF